MTVKMNDGDLYNGVTTEITLDISDSSNLDTGSEVASTWYYVYAVPIAATSTFKLTASTSSPSDGNPFGSSPFKYLGAFYNDASSNILRFTQVNKNEFRFDRELTELHSNGVTAKTTLELGYVPKTSSSATLKLHIQNDNTLGNSILEITTLGSTKGITLYATSNFGMSNLIVPVDLDTSTPRTIEYLTKIEHSSTDVHGYTIKTLGYIDDLESY